MQNNLKEKITVVQELGNKEEQDQLEDGKGNKQKAANRRTISAPSVWCNKRHPDTNLVHGVTPTTLSFVSCNGQCTPKTAR